jgi:hydroxyquinol 1,2-dioxygenase
VDSPAEAAELGLANPFRQARFDIVLQPVIA